jgi:hypothetical protein
MARMKAIGHHSFDKLSAADAIEIAKQSQPLDVSSKLFVNEHDIDLGTEVVVTADHFGLEPSHGILVAASKTRLTLRREDERSGTVHVHFPRNGFVLKKATA